MVHVFPAIQLLPVGPWEGFKNLLAATSSSIQLDAQVRLWSLLQYH
jgi:hypothetical protein